MWWKTKDKLTFWSYSSVFLCKSPVIPLNDCTKNNSHNVPVCFHYSLECAAVLNRRMERQRVSEDLPNILNNTLSRANICRQKSLIIINNGWHMAREMNPEYIFM